MYHYILSKHNELIKKIVKLATNRIYREECGLAVIYGKHLLEEGLKFQLISQIFILEDSLKKYDHLLRGLPETGIEVNIIDKNLLDKINILDSPTDLVGVIRIKASDLYARVYSSDCVILENIQDVGNLGAIIRSSLAGGIKNIILSKNCADIYNPKVLRASQGVQLGANIYPDIDLKKFISDYKGQVMATSPYANNMLYELDLTNPTALVFGNEGHGLSEELLNQILLKVKIPMDNLVDSLNVAMCATVCIFEMVRQRLKI